jgi:hypothetical protein
MGFLSRLIPQYRRPRGSLDLLREGAGDRETERSDALSLRIRSAVAYRSHQHGSLEPRAEQEGNRSEGKRERRGSHPGHSGIRR